MSFWFPLLIGLFSTGLYTALIRSRIRHRSSRFHDQELSSDKVVVYVFACALLGSVVGFYVGLELTHLDMYGPGIGVFGGAIGSAFGSVMMLFPPISTRR
jgi:uncharacterized membrane protein HdeD (DUF308 family)